jgi:acetylornithine/N-succinyldiaminopimelate aminotransferase
MSLSSSILPVFSPMPVAFRHGEGVYVYDTQGKRYLDFGSGVAVNVLGHQHPALIQALEEQGRALWHCSNWYQVPNQERAAKVLTDNSFADYAFFGNSGAEAIECGIKMVRRYFSTQDRSNRYTIVVCTRAFHGRTTGAMAATGAVGCGPSLPGFHYIPYNDTDALKDALNTTVAAVLIEPIQGEGGVFPADIAYIKTARALTKEKGILLFLDEIQTGIGRTGKFFAYEWADIVPDVLASAKGLGGGFPVGVCLATKEAAKGMDKGSHGSTFGGNPLGMRIVLAVLDEVLKKGFLENVDDIARYLWQALVDLTKHYPSVFPLVRGAGLLLGLKCKDNHRTVAEHLLHKGLLVIPAGDNVIRLIPPLIITKSHVDEAIAILKEYANGVQDA